jgi:phosphoribosyl 1,2-cyclic phosphate phosphodiesterase
MQIRLLGTGGADGIPGLFSNDEVSRYARANGGKDIRTRAAALIDGVLKIDLPPETAMQVVRDGVDPRDWTALIFTHSHEDHCAFSEIQYALYPFVSADNLPFSIFANAAVIGMIKERYPLWPMELIETRSFESFRHGPFEITPVEANHIEGEDCHNLIVERDGKRLLYATDTGVWTEKTFDYMKSTRLDAMIIECTDGFTPSGYQGHLDVKACLQMVQTLRESGALSDDSPVITTHHSHSGGARHCDLERALNPFGVKPGYDGMVLEI